jgi:hypothetical protein
MNAAGRWRRWAVKLAQHAPGVMPGARAPWADAMRRELDYIGDDAAALRWALGCVVASYRARLTRRPDGANSRAAWRVAASGAVILVIGFALQDNAGGQTAPPRPAFDETACEPSQREAVQDLRSQDLRSQDRARGRQPGSADAKAIACRPDCAHPLPPDRQDICKSPATLRANEQAH